MKCTECLLPVAKCECELCAFCGYPGHDEAHCEVEVCKVCKEETENCYCAEDVQDLVEYQELDR